MEPRVDAEKPESRRAARRNSSGSGEGIIVKQPLPSSLGRSRKTVNGHYQSGSELIPSVVQHTLIYRHFRLDFVFSWEREHPACN